MSPLVGFLLMSVRNLARSLLRFHGDRRGNLAVYASLAMLPLLGSVAAVIEYINGTREQSQLQNRLDAAVLAGARADTDQVKAAEAHFSAI